MSDTIRNKADRLKHRLLDHLLMVMESAAEVPPDEKMLAVVLNTVKALKDEPGDQETTVKAKQVSAFLQRYQAPQQATN